MKSTEEGIRKNKLFFFLIDLIDKCSKNSSNSVLNYVCLCIYEMNGSNYTRDGREELGLFGYHKVDCL